MVWCVQVAENGGGSGYKDQKDEYLEVELAGDNIDA